jgi:adenosylhomocysteine nucleosidase
LAPHVSVGDVVVASELLQHDMNAEPLFPQYEVPLSGCAKFKTDEYLTRILLESARHTLPQVQVHAGLIISGDQFVASAFESLRLQQALPEALAVEMEGAALAQVCRDYGVPLCVVRTLSDRADDAAHIDFSKFVKEVASHYSVTLVSEFLKRLPT